MGTSLQVAVVATVGAGRVAVAEGRLTGLLVAEGTAAASCVGVREASSSAAGEGLAGTGCVGAAGLVCKADADVSGVLLG